MLARRAAMSSSYKPALLKALVRVFRRTPNLNIELEDIGAEFVHLYWNQTVIFHLRQAASLTKEPEVLKAIRAASESAKTRRLDEVPPQTRQRLVRSMVRILKLDVLHRFHASAPAAMTPLFTWEPNSPTLAIPQETRLAFQANALGFESLANLWWARYLERVNVLAPYIVEKVEREGATRGPLSRFLRILQEIDEASCFYCGRPLEGETVHVDHVIPWSYLLSDPAWDLVLACAPCNLAKSDVLPARDYLAKLIMVNERRARSSLPVGLRSPLMDFDRIAQYYDAAIAIEWPSGWYPV